LPWGLCGGHAGTSSWNFVNPDPEVSPCKSKMMTTLLVNDLYRHITGGGGGYGPPWERESSLVVQDIRNQKLSRKYAEKEYGVVLRSGTFSVNESETTCRRNAMSNKSKKQ
jgi:N-methylhydantoinase B